MTRPPSGLTGSIPLATALRATSPAPSTPPTRTTVVLYSLMVFIWGTTWYVIRIGLEHYPPFFSIAVRFLIAGALLLVWLRLGGTPIPWAARHQPFFFGLGVLQFTISYGVVYWAEQYLPSGLVAVIFALLPLVTGILAHWMLTDDRLTPPKMAGLLVSLGGIVMINLSQLDLYHERAPLAAWVMLLSPLAVAIATILSKRRALEFPPMALAGLPMIYGGLINAGVWWVAERQIPLRWSWSGVGAFAYLTLLGSVVTFAIYYHLLRRASVTRLSLTAYLVPLIALVVGFLLGGETLTPFLAAGSALVLGGVAVANRR